MPGSRVCFKKGFVHRRAGDTGGQHNLIKLKTAELKTAQNVLSLLENLTYAILLEERVMNGDVLVTKYPVDTEILPIQGRNLD